MLSYTNRSPDWVLGWTHTSASWSTNGRNISMGDYRYHELRPLISYFPCHWVVPVDFPNTWTMTIVRIFYRIIARYGHDVYTLTQSFPNQQWYNKSKYDLVERLLFPLSFIDDILNLRKGIRMCPNFGWSLTRPILARVKPF